MASARGCGDASKFASIVFPNFGLHAGKGGLDPAVNLAHLLVLCIDPNGSQRHGRHHGPRLTCHCVHFRLLHVHHEITLLSCVVVATTLNAVPPSHLYCGLWPLGLLKPFQDGSHTELVIISTWQCILYPLLAIASFPAVRHNAFFAYSYQVVLQRCYCLVTVLNT